MILPLLLITILFATLAVTINLILLAVIASLGRKGRRAARYAYGLKALSIWLALERGMLLLAREREEIERNAASVFVRKGTETLH